MYIELDQTLSQEQNILKEAAHKFAKEVIRPTAIAVDRMTSPEEIVRQDSIWWRAKRKARELGYHLAAFPQAVGGLEFGPLEQHIVLEEFGWGSPGFALSIFTDAFPAMVALLYHPENRRLRDEIVMPFLADTEAKIVSCAAIAEPAHGSDAILCFTRHCQNPKMAFNTRAVRKGDEWVVTGQKAAWVSNAPAATHAITWVSVCDSSGVQGGGLAIVPLAAPGVTRGKPISLLGSRDFPQCEIVFDEVRIPGDYLVIGPALYEAAVDQFLNMAGLAVGAVFTGLARAAFEKALEYAQQRVQGGTPIAEHQIIKAKLFDMFTKVEAARAYSRAAMKYCLVPRQPVPVEYSAAVKVYCTQVAFEVAHEAVQIHGAYGLSNDFLVEKLFRDARVSLVGDGCNEALSLKRAFNVIENYPVEP